MGAILSFLEGVERMASPDICDDETWDNTLHNRSSYTVEQMLATSCGDAFIADAVFEEFPLTVELLSPASSSSSLSTDSSSGRRRLDFAAANNIAFYSVGAPADEIFGRCQVENFP
jgi:hypothetical protein